MGRLIEMNGDHAGVDTEHYTQTDAEPAPDEAVTQYSQMSHMNISLDLEGDN